MKDSFRVKGQVILKLLDADGNIKTEQKIDNLVVNTGFSYIASRMIGVTQPVMSHIAIGTSNTATAGSQTALIAELARVALNSTTLVTTAIANDSVEYTTSFPAGTGTGTLTEAGLFNNATTGIMACRTVFTAINKGALDTLNITWKLVVA
jgi:hypothetical protein